VKGCYAAVHLLADSELFAGRRGKGLPHPYAAAAHIPGGVEVYSYGGRPDLWQETSDASLGVAVPFGRRMPLLATASQRLVSTSR